jgi:N-acetylmuramoyl-L-alanine amidase
MNSDIDTLARTLWGEARGESHEGRVAVANVVMNRVKLQGWMGKSVTQVCLKPYQFSCWLQNDVNRNKLLAVGSGDSAFVDCLAIATDAVNGELPDITGGATHYHEKHITPPWAAKATKTAEIGNHIFYKGV